MKLPTIAAAAMAILLGATANAQQEQGEMLVGYVRALKVEGNVWQIVQASGQRERLNEGDFLRQGNAVETSDNGRVVLIFQNGSTINIQPGT